jgi:tetratricopeptide (TPR) repeat protein
MVVVGGIVAGIVGAMALTVVVTLAIVGGRPAVPDGEIGPPMGPPPPDPAVVARNALVACDQQAASPSDSKRISAGVADAGLAPGLAVPACEQAVALNPDEPMAKFELARAYWAAGRYPDATSRYAEAAEAQYPAAYKALGDIYLDVTAKGLPPGEDANANKALEYYTQAANLGYPDGAAAVEEATAMIRRNTFDRANFQNADYMERLYDGTIGEAEYKIAAFAYIRGVLSTLDGNEAIFIDQACKPLISMIGLTTVDVGQMISYADGVAGTSYKYDDRDLTPGEILLRNIAVTMGQHYVSKVTFDQGARDGVVLFDQDVYGCRSTVTKRVLKNIMINTQG